MPGSTSTFAGRRKCFPAVRATHLGMVADRSAVCRSFGVQAMMDSTSGANPLSSISSASSRTRNRTEARSRLPCRRWSQRSARSTDHYVGSAPQRFALRPVRSAAIQHARRGAAVQTPGASTTPATCRASSRVGTSTSAWVRRRGRVAALRHGHCKGQGLSGPRTRLADEVSSFHERRNGLLLNGCGL